MSKSAEKNPVEESTKKPEQAATAAPAQAAPAQPQTTVDESDASTAYANFCRVTGTPEELIIDFGLNAHPMGPAPESLKVDNRIIVNFFTAKRLLAALQVSIQRHEAAFGVLETDVRKRVIAQPKA